MLKSCAFIENNNWGIIYWGGLGCDCGIKINNKQNIKNNVNVVIASNKCFELKLSLLKSKKKLEICKSKKKKK